MDVSVFSHGVIVCIVSQVSGWRWFCWGWCRTPTWSTVAWPCSISLASWWAPASSGNSFFFLDKKLAISFFFTNILFESFMRCSFVTCYISLLRRAWIQVIFDMNPNLFRLGTWLIIRVTRAKAGITTHCSLLPAEAPSRCQRCSSGSATWPSRSTAVSCSSSQSFMNSTSPAVSVPDPRHNQ